MSIRYTLTAFTVFTLIFLKVFSQGDEKTIIYEKFNNLDKWEVYEFPKIKKHSTYTIIPEGILKTESSASASAIVYKETFNVYEYPLIQWKWKVDNILKNGDAKSKDGDDYPIRIYIAFKYVPENSGIGKKLKYKTAKLFYGNYPPDSTLNYIWANKIYQEDIITNSYTSEAKMILLEKGNENVGKWLTEEVNILEDYRKAFKKEPPAEASIIIMNDTDNTGESATSYIDYIKVYR